jgi:hypothetical protein
VDISVDTTSVSDGKSLSALTVDEVVVLFRNLHTPLSFEGSIRRVQVNGECLDCMAASGDIDFLSRCLGVLVATRILDALIEFRRDGFVPEELLDNSSMDALISGAVFVSPHEPLLCVVILL